MYCTFCGKQITENSAFCKYCGKPVPQDNVFAKLVVAARTGDQEAIGMLYEKTYSKVYYTVKSMIKDEDAVFDIVQDTYLKAFAHLDSFQGDTKFLPWVRQIAANTARDWLKKKRPMLFTQMAPDDGQDTPVEELLQDARGEDLPDKMIDQKETKRLILEILEELPEDQRAVIGMFYYEEMSVKQIAAAMGVSESAVKSRLMYARNKIEKKVRELEKKGTKLYNLAPLPFLLLLFRGLKAGVAEVPNAQILQAVLASEPVGAAVAAGAAAGAAQGAAGTAAGAGATGVAGTGAAGTAAGAGATGAAGPGAVGTGAGAAGTGAGAAGTAAGAGATGAAGTGAVGTGAGAAGTAGGTGAAAGTGAGAAGMAAGAGASGAAAAGGAAATASVLGVLKIGFISLAAVAVVGLSGYGAVQLVSSLSDAQQEPAAVEDVASWDDSERPRRHDDSEAPEDSETPEEPTPIDEALEQYRTIIGQAESYDFDERDILDSPWYEPGGYRYALVQMRQDDPVPTLLLEMEIKDTERSVSDYYGRVFQYDPDTKTVRQPAGTFGDGGIRGGLAMAGDGDGMFTSSWSSGTGEEWIYRITADGDSLNHELYWTGNMFEVPDSITSIAIEWHEVDDLSALDGWTAPESGEDAVSDEDGSSALPTDGDRIVLTGTVRICSFDEIVELLGQQGQPTFDDPYGYYQNRTYRVIVLDAPQTLYLRGSGNGPTRYYSSHEVSMINLEYLDDMDQYEGRHITFSIDPDTTCWPKAVPREAPIRLANK